MWKASKLFNICRDVEQAWELNDYLFEDDYDLRMKESQFWVCFANWYQEVDFVE